LILEQLDVKFLWGRNLRLELVAGLGIALGMSAQAWSAETPRSLSTETTLAAETQDLNGYTQVSVTVNVTGQDGQPAHGVVVIADHARQLAGLTLDSDGHATTSLGLPPGDHLLTAIYGGDSAHLNSVSESRPVRAATGTTADFSIAVAPASISLQQGQSGAATASVTPINASSLTAPMFVTLSCSGLPDQSSCSFTPENIEILPNATAAVTSSMDLATSAEGQVRVAGLRTAGPPGVALAVLLPGTLCLAGIACGLRRRRWLFRIALLALVGWVGLLGTTACNPLYNYHNHGPVRNLPTPAGTYTLKVTAQSSNGITAITHSTTMVLTVQ
jgi:Bacterial Ig-like domain (group 3)